MTADARYYSLRRLSPYQGTVQVIEAPGLRAMSADGLTWHVQIQSRSHAARAAGRLRSSVHGTWRADGSGDLIETERTRAHIAVLRAQPRLPFPLADTLELWLLDADRQLPLALLATSFPGHAPPRTVEPRFVAVVAGEAFTSPSLAVQQAAGAAPQGGVPHGELLARLVRDEAGEPARAQWFRREPDGSGTGLAGSGIGPAHEERVLGPALFPELIVRERWENDIATDLVRDYHAHFAAFLLTHGNLSREARARLEPAACRRPEQLYRLRHLLPEVVDMERVKVALVEAVLRRANQPVVAQGR
jgi:hypothetical protein